MSTASALPFSARPADGERADLTRVGQVRDDGAVGRASASTCRSWSRLSFSHRSVRGGDQALPGRLRRLFVHPLGDDKDAYRTRRVPNPGTREMARAVEAQNALPFIARPTSQGSEPASETASCPCPDLSATA